jgi:hypothetical protein
LALNDRIAASTHLQGVVVENLEPENDAAAQSAVLADLGMGGGAEADPQDSNGPHVGNVEAEGNVVTLAEQPTAKPYTKSGGGASPNALAPHDIEAEKNAARRLTKYLKRYSGAGAAALPVYAQGVIRRQRNRVWPANGKEPFGDEWQNKAATYSFDEKLK